MEQYLTRQVAQGTIPQDTATSIMTYIYSRQVDKGITSGTAYNTARFLVSFCRMLGTSPEQATTNDVKRVYGQMRVSYKANSFRQYLAVTRAYLTDIKPPGVDLVAIANVRHPAPESTKTAAGMLTEEEITTILEAAGNSRNKALVSLLYEGGFRPGELRKLTWGEISTDQWGMIINTDAKTGKPRYIRIISSVQYVATWRNDYPGTAKGEGPVFVTLNGSPHPLSVSGFKRIIASIEKRARLDKHIFPYLFRHSRVTNMLRQEIPESVIRLQHWGTLKTNMLSTYAHVTGAHIDDVLLARAGIREPEQPGKGIRAFDPIQCPRCQTINPPTADWCYRCGFSFSDDQIQLEEWVRANYQYLIGYGKWISENPEKLKEWMEKHSQAKQPGA